MVCARAVYPSPSKRRELGDSRTACVAAAAKYEPWANKDAMWSREKYTLTWVISSMMPNISLLQYAVQRAKAARIADWTLGGPSEMDVRIQASKRSKWYRNRLFSGSRICFWWSTSLRYVFSFENKRTYLSVKPAEETLKRLWQRWIRELAEIVIY